MKERYTMMRRAVSLCIGAAMCAGVLLSYSSIAEAGANKVKVCHIPPGNSENFHTITISEKALEAHLQHGDIAGSCDEHCETLCDDGNECSIDACAEGGGCDNSGITNCDDYNDCTINSCDDVVGCVDEPVDAGESCDDGMACTYSDMCDGSGTCVGTDNPTCCFPDDPEGRCDDENACTDDECIVQAGAETGMCSNGEPRPCPDIPCSTNVCNPLDGECDATYLCEAPNACSEVPACDEENNQCVPVNRCEEEAAPCEVPMCNEAGGVCDNQPTPCPVGTTCNVETGACEAPIVCPCWPSIGYDSLESIWATLAPPNCDLTSGGGTLFVGDSCEDVAVNGGRYSRANCVSADTQYQLFSIVRDLGPNAQSESIRYFCQGRYRAPNINTVETVYLTASEFEVCIAEHDAFTATTNFPGEGLYQRSQDTPERRCFLPTPGIP